MRATEEISEAEKLKRMKEQEVKQIIKHHQTKNTYLDLVFKSIHVIPEDLFRLPNLEYLYLESNHLEELPEDFFENLPMLKWLDLRDNKLEYLPAGIGIHRNLKNILLERNQLSHLPPELGNVTSITGLSLRGNPLITPPSHIVEQGVQVILSYLLDLLNFTGDAVDQEEENGWHFDEVNGQQLSDDDGKLSSHSDNGEFHYEGGLSLHGPTPIPAMFHQPKSRNQRKYTSWRDKRINGSSAPKVKVNDITLNNANTQGKKSEQMDRKNWLAQMQQKKQDSMVLDEWRREAKRLQNILVPKSRNGGESVLPPYGVDTNTDGRPVTKEEREIHFDAVEEKVDRVDPKNSKAPKEATHPEGNLPQMHNITTLPKINCPMMGDAQSSDHPAEKRNENDCKAKKKQEKIELVPSGRYVRQDHIAVDRLHYAISDRERARQKYLKERIDNEVQARIRQHTSQLRSRKQKDKAKKNLLQPGRELQRELLDQKMSRNPALEYRFRAFTGDSSSQSDSKKTSSM